MQEETSLHFRIIIDLSTTVEFFTLFLCCFSFITLEDWPEILTSSFLTCSVLFISIAMTSSLEVVSFPCAKIHNIQNRTFLPSVDKGTFQTPQWLKVGRQRRGSRETRQRETHTNKWTDKPTGRQRDVDNGKRKRETGCLPLQVNREWTLMPAGTSKEGAGLPLSDSLLDDLLPPENAPRGASLRIGLAIPGPAPTKDLAAGPSVSSIFFFSFANILVTKLHLKETCWPVWVWPIPVIRRFQQTESKWPGWFLKKRPGIQKHQPSVSQIPLLDPHWVEPRRSNFQFSQQFSEPERL